MAGRDKPSAEIVPLRPRGKCPICGKPSDRRCIPSARSAAPTSTSIAGCRAPMPFPAEEDEPGAGGRAVAGATDAAELSFAVRRTPRLCTALLPPAARALYVLAHGAGAGMRHPFMATMASALAERGIATFRYQFPYMEAGSRRPDSPAVAHATVRAAVAEAARRMPGLPLVAGGKSFGGRMTSQAQAIEPLPDVAASPSSASRSTRRASPATSAATTWPRLRTDAVPAGDPRRIRRSRLLEPLPPAGREPRCIWSRTAITPSRCRRRPAARTPMSASNWPMRSPPGPAKSSRNRGRFRLAAELDTPAPFHYNRHAPRAFLVRGACVGPGSSVGRAAD